MELLGYLWVVLSAICEKRFGLKIIFQTSQGLGVLRQGPQNSYNAFFQALRNSSPLEVEFEISHHGRPGMGFLSQNIFFRYSRLIRNLHKFLGPDPTWV